jgi:hypothetical protein
MARRDHVHERDSWKGYKRVHCTAVGPTVCLTPFGVYGEPAGTLGGFHFAHERAEGGPRCEGGVRVRGDSAWGMTGTLEGGDLTLTPSILCRNDGFHGFVTNGQWVPA